MGAHRAADRLDTNPTYPKDDLFRDRTQTSGCNIANMKFDRDIVHACNLPPSPYIMIHLRSRRDKVRYRGTMEMSPMLYALHSTRVRHTKSALLSDSLRRLEQEAEPSTSQPKVPLHPCSSCLHRRRLSSEFSADANRWNELALWLWLAVQRSGFHGDSANELASANCCQDRVEMDH
jgi:hypothetical protein